MEVIMKKLLYATVAVVGICAISEGMELNIDKSCYHAPYYHGFCVQRIGRDTIEVRYSTGTLQITSVLLGMILSRIEIDDPIFYKIKQSDKLIDLRKGILEFLLHEEEEDVSNLPEKQTEVAFSKIDENITKGKASQPEQGDIIESVATEAINNKKEAMTDLVKLLCTPTVNSELVAKVYYYFIQHRDDNITNDVDRVERLKQINMLEHIRGCKEAGQKTEEALFWNEYERGCYGPYQVADSDMEEFD
jgi:hypothetical protein